MYRHNRHLQTLKKESETRPGDGTGYYTHIFNTKLNIGFKLTVTDSYSIFDERRIKGKYVISYSVRLSQIKVDPVYSSLSIGRWN